MHNRGLRAEEFKLFIRSHLFGRTSDLIIILGGSVTVFRVDRDEPKLKLTNVCSLPFHILQGHRLKHARNLWYVRAILSSIIGPGPDPVDQRFY